MSYELVKKENYSYNGKLTNQIKPNQNKVRQNQGLER